MEPAGVARPALAYAGRAMTPVAVQPPWPVYGYTARYGQQSRYGHPGYGQPPYGAAAPYPAYNPYRV
ncbi:hypothetical protein SAV14893_035190 [Streptomyces avermitilis]|uniref:Uncharacterized protein n=1 Tax=Streptomyces avermitilis TaxID=33903 RepID=A0A4D4LXB9_STRAX|nr:hypothetical protein SAV14893_035190 [Streptomyces avermitilis]GDY75714.1 hypothetical protein SAV31267_051990 [Streptomyces avermitilis]